MPKKKTSRRRRVLSGLSGSKTAKKAGCKRVKKSAATHKSGPRKGKLKPGCRFLKGDGAQCCPAGKKTSKKRSTKKATAKRKKASSKKAATKRIYSGNPKSSVAFKAGKGGRRVLKKGCRKISSGPNKGKVACKRKMSSTRRKAA